MTKIDAMYSYSQLSAGAQELAKSLGIPRLRHTGSKFVASDRKLLINWGTSSDNFPTNLSACRVINNPAAVQVAVNKLSTFQRFREASVVHPDWTTDKGQAISWLNEGHTVMARTRLRDHSGRGIVIMYPDIPDEWDAVSAALYVKYVPKKREYRVHVFKGAIIDVQRKGLRDELKDNPNVNWKIQNLANGFVYVRNDGQEVPACVHDVARSAVAALGLDFGAVDVIWNQKQNAAYCLEVNCAPGLVGTTIQSYANAFSNL